MIVVFVVLFLLAIAGWFFYSRSNRTDKKPKKIVHGKYHCVTVHYSDTACDAVKTLSGKRILSSEAPVLPLINCDSGNCSCRFQHHEERRVEERRDAYHKTFDDITESTMTMKPRSKTDRRK